MKLITKDIGYAVRALVVLAKTDQIITVSELVKKIKISYPFLRRIMQKLGKKGIVQSHKGKGGGFKLQISPQKIYLIDIINIFQGPLDLTNCIVKEKICLDIESCILRKKVKEVEKYIETKFNNVTINSLTKKEKA